MIHHSHRIFMLLRPSRHSINLQTPFSNGAGFSQGAEGLCAGCLENLMGYFGEFFTVTFLKALPRKNKQEDKQGFSVVCEILLNTLSANR
jgi:hypothetical protein